MCPTGFLYAYVRCQCVSVSVLCTLYGLVFGFHLGHTLVYLSHIRPHIDHIFPRLVLPTHI